MCVWALDAPPPPLTCHRQSGRCHRCPCRCDRGRIYPRRLLYNLVRSQTTAFRTQMPIHVHIFIYTHHTTPHHTTGSSSPWCTSTLSRASRRTSTSRRANPRVPQRRRNKQRPHRLCACACHVSPHPLSSLHFPSLSSVPNESHGAMCDA